MTQRKKLLILGGSGFVGKRLFASLGPERSIATYNTSPIDQGVYFNSLTMSVADILDRPETISHAIILLGDTKAESCATNVERSRALNVDSVRSILEQLQRWRIKPVFTSTDVVFDGAKGDYTESDQTNPILTYGSQKVEVERYIRESFDEYLIVRLAMTYGTRRAEMSFLTEWLDSIEKKQASYCASDYACSPICLEDVVEGITRLIDMGANGIFHLSGHKAYSRLQMYQILLGQVKEYFSVQLEPIPCSINELNLLEKRPLDVSMKPDKFIETTGLQLREFKDVCRTLARETFQPQPQGRGATKAKREDKMALSSVDLRDPASVWLDEGGRALGYFCKKKPVRVDEELIRELKEISAGLEGKNMRLCLHESQDAAFHEMVVLERRQNYYPPHKHTGKGESFHIIEGSLGLAVFDEGGAVIDTCVLAPQGNMIYRTGANMYHAVMPLSDLVIYHESRLGPFVREGDSVFPDWAPDGSKQEEVAAYVNRMLLLLQN